MISIPNPGGTSNELEAVSACAANDVWVVGVDIAGTFNTYALHWNCSEWTRAASPNGRPSGNEFMDATAIAAAGARAAGFYADSHGQRHALTEHWNGTNWSVIPLPDLGAGETWLHGVGASAGNKVWAVGYTADRMTIALHWDGIAWSRTTSVAGNRYGVMARTTVDVWAVGMVQDNTLTDHWACVSLNER